MANFLDILAMGLQGAGGMAGAASQGSPDDDIQVTGKPLPVRSVPEDTRSVKATSKRQEQQEETPELIKRKGRFGVGGTLRDILGTVGDAYLMANGKPSVYAPQRTKEKLASAQYGFTDDPQAATERVGELDGDAARDLYKAYTTNENQRENIGSQRAVRQDQIANRQRDDVRAVTQRLSNMLNAAKTPQGRAYVISQAQQAAGQLGVPIEQFGLSDSMTPEEAEIYASGGINRSQQEQIPLNKARVAQGQQNADANTTRANRPPAPRATPNPTTASMIAPIVQKLQAGKPLTAGEQKVYDDLRPSRGKSKRAIPPPPPGF